MSLRESNCLVTVLSGIPERQLSFLKTIFFSKSFWFYCAV